MPKASPLVVSKPSAVPRYGKTRAAMRLKKKMTEMDWATSSSLAPMTGAVAAMAEPPQIDDPTPMSVAILPGMWASLHTTYDTTSDVQMVVQIMGSDWAPVRRMTFRFRPKPSSTTAVCSRYLLVKPMPLAKGVRSLMKSVITIPSRMPKMGPPTTGTAIPSSQAGTEMARQSSRPLPFSARNVPMKTPSRHFPPVAAGGRASRKRDA